LIDAVRSAIDSGIPYFGASAGPMSPADHPHHQRHADRATAQLCGIQPRAVPDQTRTTWTANTEARVGETREERLQEFLEENDVTVVALREQSGWRSMDRR